MKTTLHLLLIFLFTCITGYSLAQIPNSDFEDWTEGLLLAEWQTNSCPPCAGPFDSYIIMQDSDNVYHGKYAAKFIHNGVNPALASVRFPLSHHPLSLVGYVRNQLHGVVGDTAFIGIKLFNNNLVVDSGEWINTIAIPDYTQLTIPVSQNTTQIDSAEISIAFGDIQPILLIDNPNFWVDYLALDFTEGIISKEGNERGLIIYPNPANSRITILTADRGGPVDLRIYNALGREVVQQSNNTGLTMLDVSQFANGVYFIHANAGKEGLYDARIIIAK